MRGNGSLMKVRTLRGGVEAMRKAGKKYLPKEERETEDDYKDRLSRSWLFPALDKAVEDAADQIFAREITLGEDVPSEIEELSENITADGRNLNEFAREVLEDGLEAGISFVFVDAPRIDEEMTRAQQAERNFRPYMTMVRAEDVLGWKTVTNGSVTQLSQIRFIETVGEDGEDEFSQEPQDQIRVLDLDESGVRVRLYRKVKEAWTLHDEFFVDVPEITVVPFYAERKGFFKATPPYETLADLNIAHWQSASDQRNILHKARVPLPFFKGVEVDKIETGPNGAIVTNSPDADGKWIEISGASISAGRDDLKDLEQRMQVLGIQLLMPKPGGGTATGEALDTAKASTPLAAYANALKDTLEKAFEFMALYMGIEGGGSLSVNTDFGVHLLGQADLQFILNARNTGQISHETFIKECVRRGILMGDIDADDEQEKLEAEIPEPQDLAEVDLETETPQEAFLRVVQG